MQLPDHGHTEESRQSVSTMVGARAFLLQASAWLLLCWYVATHFPESSFWQALVALVILALPLMLIGSYEIAIAKTLRREKYQREGLFFRLFSGRVLLLLLTLCVALLAGGFLLLRLYLLPPMEWLLLAALIPLYLLLFRLLRRQLQSQYKPWLLTAATLVWARVLCPTLLMGLYLPLLWWLQAPEPTLTLSAAIAAEQAAVANITASMTLATLAQFVAIFEGMKVFLLANLQAAEFRSLLLVIVLEAWMTCYLVCTLLSVFLLPRQEWRRIFGPLADTSALPPLSGTRLAGSSALLTFVLLFVFVPAMSYLEIWVLEHPDVSQSPNRFRLQVEQIGAAYYAPGTVDDLQRARQQVLARLDLVAATLNQQTDAAFDAMEGNVDLYLDWYYSLGGEYGRIGNLLVGNLESYMAARLTETLQQGDVFKDVQATLDASVNSSAVAQALYARLADTILAQSRIDPGDRQVVVLQSMQLQDFQLRLPGHQDLVGFQSRLLVSSGGAAAAGVLTSVVAGKLTAKIIAKSSFKLAAKALGKVVAGKAAGASLGAGTGAATGAAMGSVVPGVGTAIGAVIGGIAGGIAVGIGIDKALIELEEFIGRDEFRAQLLAAIAEARAEFYPRPAAGL